MQHTLGVNLSKRLEQPRHRLAHQGSQQDVLLELEDCRTPAPSPPIIESRPTTIRGLYATGDHIYDMIEATFAVIVRPRIP